MNPTTPRRTARTSRSRTRLAVAGLALLSLTAAACGDDDSDSAASDMTEMTETTEMAGSADTMAPATTEPMMTESTEAMDDSMSDTTMDDSMTDTTMGGEMTMMEPSGPGCASVPMDGEGSFDGMADDPAATAASNNPVLSTLVGAVDAAGLVDTLNGDGPFTIFAPTNDAFAAVPAADLEAVLADTDLLTSVLTYHVIAGEQLSSADLIEQGTAATVNGAELTFAEGADGGLEVNGVPTVCMDVPTANATVHIIGGVLLPPA